MSNLTDDYSRLLDYLENQKNASEGYALKRRKSSEVKKEAVTNLTDKLLDDSQIHSHVPQHVKKEIKSKGFDITKFESMMRSKLIDDFKKIQTYERPYISVGELYTCLRQNYYSRSRYAIDLENEFKFSWLYMFQRVGDEIHAVIQDVYNFTEKEKTIVSEIYKIKGRLDGVRDGFLYEIKSVDPDKFNYEYQKEHFFQANIYAHILNSEYNYKIHTIVILYVFRNLRKIVPFDLDINPPLAESQIKRASILLKSIAKKLVPDPIGATESQCQWCSYKKYCEKDKCNDIIQPFNVKKKKDTEEQKPSVEKVIEPEKVNEKVQNPPKNKKGVFLL